MNWNPKNHQRLKYQGLVGRNLRCEVYELHEAGLLLDEDERWRRSTVTQIKVEQCAWSDPETKPLRRRIRM